MPGAPIETKRLVLRLPVLADASAIERIAFDPRIALMTATVPHPYPTGGGRAFVESIDPGAEPMRTHRAIVDLPARGGTHRILVWRLDRGRLVPAAGA